MEKLTMLSEDDVVEIVKEQLKKVLLKSDKNSDEKSWKHLRNEICSWINSHADNKNKRSYATLSTWIYSTIRFTTGVSKVDEMNFKQLEVAYKTWEFLKNNNPYHLNHSK